MSQTARTIAVKVIIAIIATLAVVHFFVGVYIIPTTSMVPTLMPGDYILVNKLAYSLRLPFTTFEIMRFGTPGRGDIVVFSSPQGQDKVYVKRLAATGGEQVAIRGGNVYANGRPVVIPSIARNYYYNQGEYAPTPEGVRVPAGYYFFLGDNSIASGDSRFWGFVPQKDVIGKAVVIWWPSRRINMIE